MCKYLENNRKQLNILKAKILHDFRRIMKIKNKSVQNENRAELFCKI